MTEFPDMAILPNLYLITAIGKELVNKEIISKEDIIANIKNMLPSEGSKEKEASRRTLFLTAEIENVISAVRKW
ncbi:hypothetical protein [Acetobacter sp. UBA5411]|uniref:hypothetical protein n=1 Tax=Acetobacter sp. UBA5411 TaxID=1945905 RepID=UPI0025C273CA|nr:hypothetical protein [Acetobacter sp. UBA5411]